MAATHEVAPDALPYFDQGYDDPGVREMVRLLTSFKALFINRISTREMSKLIKLIDELR